MPVAGISAATTSTVSLMARVWMANQSSSQLNTFLMANQRPLGAGAASPGFDISAIAVLRGAYRAKFRGCQPQLRNHTGPEPLGWRSRGQSLQETPTDGHFSHSLLDFMCAGTQTALAARVSMATGRRAHFQARRLVLYLFHIFLKGAPHEQYRLPGWRSRHHHRCPVILRPALMGS